jgi:hypothetical protein
MRQCRLYSACSGHDYVKIVEDIDCSSSSIYGNYRYWVGAGGILHCCLIIYRIKAYQKKHTGYESVAGCHICTF